MPAEHDARLRVAIVVPAKKYLCLGGVLWTQRYGPLQVASVVREMGLSVCVFNEDLGERASAEELACNNVPGKYSRVDSGFSSLWF
jgi:hypothetical protein